MGSGVGGCEGASCDGDGAVAIRRLRDQPVVVSSQWALARAVVTAARAVQARQVEAEVSGVETLVGDLLERCWLSAVRGRADVLDAA